jgi:methylthioribulose-1-phosphate dehydratase
MNNLQALKEEVASVIRAYNAKGWSPATSTNYSFKERASDAVIHVSRSGVDKSLFSSADFISIDATGLPTAAYEACTPSAETLIHCAIYALFPETTVILHSHSIYPVLISQGEGKAISFNGYEIQKGFAGQTTHNCTISIPIFDNSQNMHEFSQLLLAEKEQLHQHSLIIRKHGTYAWGKNLFEAKRHLETLEYLCQCAWMNR